MDADGSNMKRPSDCENDYAPLCSSDGNWVYYFDGKGNRSMRVPLNGGKAEELPSIAVLGSQVFALLDIFA